MKGVFAIVAGVLTIANGKARIGPYVSTTTVFSGPTASLIGGLAIVLGLFLLVAG
jgi:hypothetical protein